MSRWSIIFTSHNSKLIYLLLATVACERSGSRRKRRQSISPWSPVDHDYSRKWALILWIDQHCSSLKGILSSSMHLTVSSSRSIPTAATQVSDKSGPFPWSVSHWSIFLIVKVDDDVRINDYPKQCFGKHVNKLQQWLDASHMRWQRECSTSTQSRQHSIDVLSES